MACSGCNAGAGLGGGDDVKDKHLIDNELIDESVNIAGALFNSFGGNEDEQESFIRRDNTPKDADGHEKLGARYNLRLVDRALEDIGGGPYQRRLLALAMFSLFLDVSEMSLTSLLYVEFQKIWDHPKPEALAVIGSLSATGQVVGLLFFGWMSDRFGRLSGLLMSFLIILVAGVISSFANSVLFFAVCRLFLGIGVGGNIVIAQSILVECVPGSKRGPYMIFTGISYGLAQLVMVVLAWILFPTIGWRWLIRGCAIFIVPVLFLLPYVVESPRYHIVTGNLEKAVDSMKVIASANSQPIPEYFCYEKLQAHYVASSDKSSFFNRSSPIFRWRNLKVMAALTPYYFLLSVVGSIYGFLPYELKRYLGGASIPYITAIIMSSAGIVATIINMQVVRRLPRIFVLRFGTLASAFATLSLVLGKHPVLIFTSVFFMNLMGCAVTATLHLYTSEIFATNIRITMAGIGRGFHRLGYVVGPFLVAAVIEIGLFWTSIIYSLLLLVATGVTFLFTEESFERDLYEGDVDIRKKEEETAPVSQKSGGYEV